MDEVAEVDGEEAREAPEGDARESIHCSSRARACSESDRMIRRYILSSLKLLTFFLRLEVRRVEVVGVGMTMELLPEIVDIVLRETQGDETVKATSGLQLP